MKRSWLLVLLVCLAVAMVLGAWLRGPWLLDPPTSRVDLLASQAAEDERTDLPRPLQAGEPEPLAEHDEAVGATAQIEVAVLGEAVGRDLVDELLAALRQADEVAGPDEGPAPAGVSEADPGFHRRAVRNLHTFAGREQLEDPVIRASVIAGLQDAVHAGRESVRVDGAVLALLGLWGEQQSVLDLSGLAGERWRSGLLGLCWDARPDPQDQDQVRGIALEPAEYLATHPRGALRLLPVTIDRVPDEDLERVLRPLVLELADDVSKLLDRELAVLALGTGLDSRPSTLDLFQQILFDTSPAMLQVRNAVCYALGHADSPEARAVLMAFLKDPQVGDLGKDMARWLASSRPVLEGEVAALAAPLLDPDSTDDARMLATFSLFKRVPMASAEEMAQIEGILAVRCFEEPDATARVAALQTLGYASGGLKRMMTLDQVLRADASTACRSQAARGLGRTTGPLRIEALSLLRASLQAEQDERVRAEIGKALEQAEQRAGSSGRDGDG